jgi:hypothetical protein
VNASTWRSSALHRSKFFCSRVRSRSYYLHALAINFTHCVASNVCCRSPCPSQKTTLLASEQILRIRGTWWPFSHCRFGWCITWQSRKVYGLQGLNGPWYAWKRSGGIMWPCIYILGSQRMRFASDPSLYQPQYMALCSICCYLLPSDPILWQKGRIKLS